MSDQDPSTVPPADAHRVTVRPTRAPAPVIATAVLLAVGGIQIILSAATDTPTTGWIGSVAPRWLYLSSGLLYMLLGWFIYRGRAWARIVLLVLVAAGVVLIVVRAFDVEPARTVASLVFPVVYAILVNTYSARLWFGALPEETVTPVN